MSTYIQKLQSKSEQSRKQILVGSLIASMGIVMMVWIYTLGGFFNGSTTQVATTTDDANQVRPFDLLSNSIKDAYQNITASVGKISTIKNQVDQAPQKQIDLIPVEHTTN